MKIGDIVPRAGIKHTSLAFRASVLSLHHVGSVMSPLYIRPPFYAAPCLTDYYTRIYLPRSFTSSFPCPVIPIIRLTSDKWYFFKILLVSLSRDSNPATCHIGTRNRNLFGRQLDMMVESVERWSWKQDIGSLVSSRVKPMTYQIDTCRFLACRLVLIGYGKDWLAQFKISDHDASNLISQWGCTIKSPQVYTVTSWYDLKCYKDIKLQQPTIRL